MITFQTYGDESECKSLWNQYSSKKNLWDVWKFRRCFHTKASEFNFILCFENGKEIGLLPLTFDRKEKMYTYFGDTFPEKNKFFLKKPSLLDECLYECPYHTSIYYIDSTEAKHSDQLEIGEKRYYLNLKKYSSFEDYLRNFTKKHRKNLRYDLKKIQEKNCKIRVNKISDFETLIKFNKQGFGKESNFNSKEFEESMNSFIKIASGKKMMDMISIKIEGKTEAVGLGIVYKKCYYVLATGRNVEIKNLGKMLIAEQIKSSIEKKCDEIDFLSTESKWKELWNLESEQLYDFYS